MSRIITLIGDYKIVYPEYDSGMDYDVLIEISSKDDIEKVGSANVNAMISYAMGVVDTTITSERYNCTLMFPENGMKTPPIALFTKKRIKNITPVDTTDPKTAKGYQLITGDNKIGKEFRGIRSKSGNSSMHIDDGFIELNSGDNKLSISPNGIAITGNLMDINLPTKNQGGLFKESGILRFLPKAFVPPFCFPDYLPDVATLARVAKTMQIVKSIMKIGLWVEESGCR